MSDPTFKVTYVYIGMRISQDRRLSAFYLPIQDGRVSGDAIGYTHKSMRKIVGRTYVITRTDSGSTIVGGENKPVDDGAWRNADDVERWKLEEQVALAQESQRRNERALRKQVGEFKTLDQFRVAYANARAEKRAAILAIVIREITRSK